MNHFNAANTESLKSGLNEFRNCTLSITSTNKSRVFTVMPQAIKIRFNLFSIDSSVILNLSVRSDEDPPDCRKSRPVNLFAYFEYEFRETPVICHKMKQIRC